MWMNKRRMQTHELTFMTDRNRKREDERERERDKKRDRTNLLSGGFTLIRTVNFVTSGLKNYLSKDI